MLNAATTPMDDFFAGLVIGPFDLYDTEPRFSLLVEEFFLGTTERSQTVRWHFGGFQALRI
jgi:hypothetical protein